MSLKLTVSAPGKVILSGEHSVVYGKAAIAGVIGLRNTLTLEATSPKHIQLKFDLFPDRVCSIAIDDFSELLAKLHLLCDGKPLPAQVPHERFVELIGEFLRAVPDRCPGGSEDTKFELTCLAAVYLLAGCLCASGCTELRYGFVVSIRSDVPMGAGLGSSASFGVCLAAAFHFYANYRLNPNCVHHHNNQAVDSAERQSTLETISAWAFCSERLMHGNPSGLDNTICTFGQLVKFYKQQTPVTVSCSVPVDMLLIDSGVSRNTRDLVQQVADRTRDHPGVMGSLMQAMDHLVEDILRFLVVATADEYQAGFAQLRRLITMNNDLLRAIGVSHPVLEQITRVCDAHGVASKLTGAGGGGFAFAVLPPDVLPSVAEELGNALVKEGLMWMRTTVGGPGVVVVDETVV